MFSKGRSRLASSPLDRPRRLRLDNTQRRRVVNLAVIKQNVVVPGAWVVVDQELNTSGRRVYPVESITAEGFVRLKGWPVAINPRRLTVISDSPVD